MQAVLFPLLSDVRFGLLFLAVIAPLALFFVKRRKSTLAPPSDGADRAIQMLEQIIVKDDGSPGLVADKGFLPDQPARTVLIVDDDPVTRFTLNRLFVQAGFVSQEVEDGQKAVEKYARGERFDMVVMDHDMPTLNGVDAVKALRTFDRHVTIMALTTHDPVSKEQEFLRVGANFVAPKPVTRTKLKEVLQQYELMNW